MMMMHVRLQGVDASTSSQTVSHYFSRARKAAGSTSGSSISVEVVAIPPLNMASNTALPTARTNLRMSAVTATTINIREVKRLHIHKNNYPAVVGVLFNAAIGALTCVQVSSGLPFLCPLKNERHSAPRC